MPRQDVLDAIERGALEEGMDPATAKAFAERESSFRPGIGGTGSIRGLYQMTGDKHRKYGDSPDPYEQTKAWSRFARDLRGEMARHLGRDPTDTELYLGHHFGGGRAARMISGSIHPDTSVYDVFRSRELLGNPHIRRAGTVGNLASTTMADIDRRRAKWGGEPGAVAARPAQSDWSHWAQFGELVGREPSTDDQPAQDWSHWAQFGERVTGEQSEPTQPAWAQSGERVTPASQRPAETTKDLPDWAPFGQPVNQPLEQHAELTTQGGQPWAGRLRPGWQFERPLDENRGSVPLTRENEMVPDELGHRGTQDPRTGIFWNIRT